MSVEGNIYDIPTPFAMYVGGCSTKLQAKVAAGVLEWAPHKVAYTVDDTKSLFDFKATGEQAQTLVIGCAPFGGRIDDAIDSAIRNAIKMRLNVAAGLHERLNDNIEYVELAKEHGIQLFDFRHRAQDYPIGTGLKREGLRILTVGTDCSCGKKFTALSITTSLQLRTVPNVKFCSTGQTGFLISNCGINNDTIVADFLAGAAEFLSPSEPDTIFVIEGQGAIRHPAYTGGSMSLIAGSQPDAIVLCHTAGRTTMTNTSRVIDIRAELDANMRAAAIHGWNPRLIGISVNFCEVDYSEGQKKEYMSNLSHTFACPVFDPSSPNLDYTTTLNQIEKMAKCKS